MRSVDSVEPLTPNQLLTQKCSVVLPPPGRFHDPDLYSRQRWRRVQHIANEFWTRWRRELLLSMQFRTKLRHQKRSMTVGDIVTVIEDDAPRCSWPLGRVVAVHPAADGLVRRARVRVGSGEYERPVHRLIWTYSVSRKPTTSTLPELAVQKAPAEPPDRTAAVPFVA